MANHSIFSTQALPNSLCPPLSYLKSEIQNKPWNNMVLKMSGSFWGTTISERVSDYRGAATQAMRGAATRGRSSSGPLLPYLGGLVNLQYLYELLKKQQRTAMISDYIQNDIFLNLYMSMFAVSCMAIAWSSELRGTLYSVRFCQLNWKSI